MHSSYPVILFDGVCNFCNSTVNTIIRLDKKGVFKFAPLQSEVGRRYLQMFDHVMEENLNTVVLICDGRLYTKSDAALQTFKHLGGPWRYLRVFTIVPRKIRNAVYDFIARHRYKWFGKKDTCMMPTPDIKARFLA
ncbi:MAG TPA: thiol-disulfide oxidoreductase DCC family protein [Bacteroidetes bacterium]|nr:thiol-disulfide oxidoreductase DCC family protein [Bacteroidota bacterium]